MKIKVKRRHILDALRYNHLQAGAWFHDFTAQIGYHGEKIKPFNPNCSACLVGSAVRRAVPSCTLSEAKLDAMAKRLCNSLGTQADRYGLSISAESNADKLIKKKLYLPALSAKFEGILRKKYNPNVENLSDARLSAKERKRIHA